MYEVFDHICANVKLVYCVTIDCLQSDLFLWSALYLCQCAVRNYEKEILYVCNIQVPIYDITWCHNLHESNVNIHYHKNLNSYKEQQHSPL